MGYFLPFESYALGKIPPLTGPVYFRQCLEQQYPENQW